MVCPLFADDFVLYGESKEDMRVVVGYFVEVYKRKGFKVNVGRKVMVFGGEEGLEYEVCIDRIHLILVKCFGYIKY